MLLLTTRGGSRYRKLPEGTITPLRQAQQTERERERLCFGGRARHRETPAAARRREPPQPLAHPACRELFLVLE